MHTHQDLEQIHDDMERDRFFGSDEAVTYGLVDRVSEAGLRLRRGLADGAIVGRVRPALAVPLCVLAIAGCDLGRGRATPDPGRDHPARLDAALVRSHLSALQRIADRDGGNRAAGTRGYAESARYVAARLRAAGWRVALERFRFPAFTERDSSLAVTPGGALRPGRDFRTLLYSGAGRAEGPLTTAGRACTPGDIALIRPGAVVLISPGGCLFRTKAVNAERAGAAGLLIVDPARGRAASTATLVAPRVRIPVMILSRAAARGLRPGGRAAMAVDARTRYRRGTDVVAESRGRGSAVVMAGAHLDSVPSGPGINDNGSGVSALLALAESTGRSAPGAPIRLAFWGAEELGLYGSRRYVAELTPGERERILAYVNLDMVGSPNAVRAVYAAKGSGRRTRPRAQRIESLLNGLVKPTQHSSGASDHVPFARAGIPVGGVFTGASERGPGGRPRDACYHLACDRLENVDVPLVVRLARASRSAMLALSRQAK